VANSKDNSANLGDLAGISGVNSGEISDKISPAPSEKNSSKNRAEILDEIYAAKNVKAPNLANSVRLSPNLSPNLAASNLSNLAQIPVAPAIEYPCEWEYRVIIAKSSPKSEISRVLRECYCADFSVAKSHENGKFVSYKVRVRVASDDERTAIFRALQGIAKFVL